MTAKTKKEKADPSPPSANSAAGFGMTAKAGCRADARRYTAVRLRGIAVGVWLAALCGAGAGTGFAQAQKAAPAAAAAPAGNVANGKKVFVEHGCFSCHGFSGEGGPGARLAQSLIPFPAFVQYVRQPKRTMPPYGAQVSDQELADIYAYLKTIPPSPDVKSIPLLTNP